VRVVADTVTIPVVAFGGAFTWQHLVEGVTIGRADAVLRRERVPLHRAEHAEGQGVHA